VRISVRQLVGALLLSGFSIAFGFIFSKFIIDVPIREADAVLLRCAQDFEREQTTMTRQFGADYELLQLKVNAIRAGKEKKR